MSYYDSFVRLLSPLGVYALREDSLSGAELFAAGQALDALYAQAKDCLREAVPATAQDVGLSMYQSLAGCAVLGDTPEEKRENLRWLLEKTAGSWTLDRARAAAQCVAGCTVEEGDTPGTVTVKGLAGAVISTVQQAEITERLPAHIQISFPQET